jgi:hypothetical protein
VYNRRINFLVNFGKLDITGKFLKKTTGYYMANGKMKKIETII